MKVKVKVITREESTTTKVTLNAEELKMILKEMKQEKNACTCKANTTPATPVTPTQTQTPTEKPVVNNKTNNTTQAPTSAQTQTATPDKPVAKATKEAANVTEAYRQAKADWDAVNNQDKVFATSNVNTNPAQTQATTPEKPVSKATKEEYGCWGNDKPKAVQHTGTDPQAPTEKPVNNNEEKNLLGISEDSLKILKALGLVEICGDATVIKLYEDKELSDVLYGDNKDKALFDTIVSFENHGISIDDVCNGVYDYYKKDSVVSKHMIFSEFRIRGIEAMVNTEYKKRGGKGYIHLYEKYKGKMYVTYPTIAAAF